MVDRAQADQTRRKAKRILLLVIVSSVVLVVGVVLGSRVTGAMAVRAEVEAAEAAGYPMSAQALRDLHPQPAPEDGPHSGDFYQRAIEVWTQAWTQALAAAQPYQAPPVPYFGDVDVPPRGTPWPEELMDETARFLDEKQEALELLYRASGKGPAWFDLDFEEAMNMPLTFRGPLRGLKRLMALDAEHAANEGRVDDAVAGLLALWGMTDAPAEVPEYLTQLLRVSIAVIAMRTTERVLATVDLSPSQLASLQRRVEEIDLVPGMRLGMMGQAAMTHMTYEHLWEGRIGSQPIDRELELSVTQHIGIYHRLHVFYLRQMRELIEWIEAYARGERRDPPPTVDHPIADRLSLVAIIDSDWVAAEIHRGEATLALTRVGLAVARHKVDHDAYPDTLDDLVPAYLEAVPRDPYTDAPLRYRAAETGVIVYSLGTNRTDHQGREIGTEGWADRGMTDSDFTFTLGDAQAELWPDRWPQWPPEER